MNRVGDLEIDQDLAFQHRSWVLQRIIWGVMVAFLVMAGVGLLGPGPLSSTRASAADVPLQVEYNRFARLASKEQLRLTLQPGAFRNGEARVWMTRDFVDAHNVENITPEPDSTELGSERVTFTFKAGDDAGESAIVFDIQPDEIGRQRGETGLEGGQGLPIRQFIYP